MSPLLFIIYTFDIALAIPPTISLLQYADDIVIYSKETLGTEINSSLQLTINNLESYFRTIGININPNKSSMMIFAKDSPVKVRIRLNNEVIPIKSKHFFLGMWIESKLKWNDHIYYLIKKSQNYILKCGAGTRWGHIQRAC